MQAPALIAGLIHALRGAALWQVDLVTFSYSLTMIPDWFAAMDNANALLAPEGTLGVVDFCVSRKYPTPGLRSNSWLQRTFWPAWFAHDNVFLSSDHVPYLRRRFPIHVLHERLAQVPYVGRLMPPVPYYIFVGHAPSSSHH